MIQNKNETERLTGEMMGDIRLISSLVAIAAGGLPLWVIKKFATDVVSVETRREKIYFCILPIVLVVTDLYICSRSIEDISFDTVCLKVLMLSLLGGVAYVDHKSNLIPNEFLIVALILRGFIFVGQVLINGYDDVYNILYELMACVILFLFCFLIRFLSKKGLGMGDIKLITILPLFFGPVGGFRVMFYAMIIIFFQSLFCLLTKRKGKKDVLPFGPAIATGAWISLIIVGF